VLDTAASVSAPTGSIAIQPVNVLFLGDSITAGVESETTFGLLQGDSTLTYAYDLAHGPLQAEFGQIGWPGQGWINAVSGNEPALPSTWSNYFAGSSRLFTGKLSPVPEVVIVNEGTNDTGNNQAAIVAWIAAARSALNPATPVILIIPFGQFEAANIAAAVATAGDPYVFVINVGVAASYGLNGSTASQFSYDGKHPNGYAAGWLSAWIAGRIENQVGGGLISGGAVISGSGLIH
jgi:lysophospholipase L1-like esterase